MRKKIQSELEAKLLVESRNTCNLCWEKKDIQIHHIRPIEQGGDNSEDNLIILCLDCHSKVHTKRNLARSYTEETLRLYKEKWIELVKKYPFSKDFVSKENDITIIEKILRVGDRRALYFPIHYEVPISMCDSIRSFRIEIQKSGYRLIKNDTAIDSIKQIYKSLVEIEYLFPTNRNSIHSCLLDVLGREGSELLELKRQKIIYHLNQLSKLIGHGEIFNKDEFSNFGFNLKSKNKKRLDCFGNYNPNSPKCDECEYKEECILASN